MTVQQTPAGWYAAPGDPAGTMRYWDGGRWVGAPTPAGGSPTSSSPVVGSAAVSSSPVVGTTAAVDYAGGDAGYAPFTPGRQANVEQPPLADGWVRIGGRIIDAIVWFVLFIAVSITGGVAQAIAAGSSGEATAATVVVALLTLLVGVVAVVAYEMLNVSGGTVGKRLANTVVVKADGSPLDTGTAVRRMTLHIVVQLAFVPAYVLSADAALIVWIATGTLWWIIAIAGLAMVFAHRRRQTPWDLVGGTIVVRKRR
ncbi:MAG: RDD family protein [Actinomycetota bacterium]